MQFMDLISLSDADKLKAIDCVEDMPIAVKIDIRRRINQPDFNPLIKNGNRPNISIYSSLLKYVDPTKNRMVDNASADEYQKQFSILNEMIDKAPEYDNLRRMKADGIIKNLATNGFYDAESAIVFEQYISKSIGVTNTEEGRRNLATFFTTRLIPLKAEGYDFYTFLSFNEYISKTLSTNFHLMQDLVMPVVNIPLSTNKAVHINDMGVYIYLYFKELGVEKVVDKYGFDKRFIYYFDEVNPIFKESLNIAKQFALQNMSSEDAISLIRDRSYKISNIAERSSYNNIESVDKILKADGCIIQSDNGCRLFSKVNNIGRLIRNITVEKILEYMSNNIKEHDITFYMTDNDIGNLSNTKDLIFGLAYDGYNHRIKYFGKYDDDYYVFYKNIYNPGKIYGISLHGDDNKNIVEITLPTRYYYRNISNSI